MFCFSCRPKENLHEMFSPLNELGTMISWKRIRSQTLWEHGVCTVNDICKMLEQSNIGLHLDHIRRIKLPHDGKEVSHNYLFFEDWNKMFICHSLDLLIVNYFWWTNIWEAGSGCSPLSVSVKLLGIFLLSPFFLSLFFSCRQECVEVSR